ncbi:protein CEBPZOS isoform X2 [Accipiter gentilis]|uniref:protein CEBPZOS isoform X2 n=1 Tax=Astur gentilis TaxID=8957 RepID=UPI0021100C5C|nr:protein CEBPZOS isoform X2 [Accipiter gentilis]
MATCTQRPRCANQRPRLGLRRQRRSRGGEGGAAGCRDAPPSACGRAVGRRLRRNPGHRRRRGVRHNGPRRTRAEALRTRGPPAQKRCANGGRCGRSAHAQPLPAVTEGRRAPVAVMARRVVKGLLLLEAAGLLGALLLYRAMDRSQDFRYTMQKRFPSILEALCA